MHNLRFLGGASIEGPEGSVAGPAAQARRLAFLACLVVARGQPVSRDKLIAMLWPENAPESARHSLRNTVYVLNHELKGDPVESVGNGLRIDPERFPSDVAAFQTALESGDLERAVELYGGGFLDGLFLKDALEFEEWARGERDRFARAYGQALEELAERATQRGDHLQAVSWWRDLVAHDPYSSRATVRLMESLAAAGDRAEALRQADAHKMRMREEFDAAPDSAVTELAELLQEVPTEGVAVREPWAVGEEARYRPGPIRRARLPLAIGAAITAVAVWYVALRDTEPGPEHAAASIDARAIAVLPFSVRGEEVAVLREGMVDLLSTGLDGAGGLRTIPVGTVMTRWRESVVGEEAPELTTALEVARRTTAQYALVGSVVAIDTDVRIVVDVYDVHTNESLGQAKVEGSSDDVLPLVDRLAVEALAIILEKGEEEIPEIDLVSLMTTSLEALTAYLEGEVHYRHYDFAAAKDAYNRAVEADSTFALAHYRLGYVYAWGQEGSPSPTAAIDHFLHAARLADRLPARAAAYVRTLHAWIRGTSDWEPLRHVVQTYPEDAEARFLLGEVYLHTNVFATAEEIDHLFQQAVELDPRNAVYLIHHVQFAWWLPTDRTRAAERLEMYERVAPDSPLAKGGRLALDLAFGDSAAQRKAMDRLRDEDLDVVHQVWRLLYHPRHEMSLVVNREFYARGDDNQKDSAAGILFRENARWHGRLREALPYLDDPAITAGSQARAAYHAYLLGLPIPEGTLEQLLDPAMIDSIAEEVLVFYAGAFAADRGRWSDHARASAELENRQERAFAGADSAGAMRLVGRAVALEGYGLWQRGQPVAALPLLEDVQTLRFFLGWLWLGQLYQELDRLRDAERVYRSYNYGRGALSIEPLSQRQLGKIYEQLEEYDKAVESYEYFVHYWQDADPELQPMVEEARQAIIRLEGLRRE